MNKFKRFFLIFILSLCSFCISQSYAASKGEPDFPRIAGVYSPREAELISDNIQTLSKFDLLMMNMNTGQFFPEAIKAIRENNPNIKILVYINSSGIETRPKKESSKLLNEVFYAGIRDEWWVRDPEGNILPAYASKEGTGGCLNVTNLCPLVHNQRWNSYVVDFMADKVLSGGLWDGVMFDVVRDNIVQDRPRMRGRQDRRRPDRKDRPQRLSDREFDLDRDGRADEPEWVNKKWQEGYRLMFTYARERFGKDVLIIANGDHTYYDYVNGKVFENFPKYISSTRGDWIETMKLYHTWLKKAQPPKAVIFDTRAEPGNYQALRFALTSALMDDGYFSHVSDSIEDKKKGVIFWYDEYDNAGKQKGYLGKPKGPAIEIMPKVYRRDFDKGIVLCNMSNNKQATVKLETTYKKIKGQQDPQVNDGSIVENITLPAQDGIILLR